MTSSNSEPVVRERKLNAAYGYRSDVPRDIYRGSRYTHVEWQTRERMRIRIALEELRAVLEGARPRSGDGKRILFILDPQKKTIKPDGRPRVSLPGMMVN